VRDLESATIAACAAAISATAATVSACVALRSLRQLRVTNEANRESESEQRRSVLDRLMPPYLIEVRPSGSEVRIRIENHGEAELLVDSQDIVTEQNLAGSTVIRPKDAVNRCLEMGAGVAERTVELRLANLNARVRDVVRLRAVRVGNETKIVLSQGVATGGMLRLSPLSKEVLRIYGTSG
jgi:sulfur relay (sulfurtransferase) complex TusBCD TusD component (DsrE family)